MTQSYLRRLNGVELLELLARTMTELDDRGAGLHCGVADCQRQHRAEAVLDSEWASIHRGDEGDYALSYHSAEAPHDAANVIRQLPYPDMVEFLAAEATTEDLRQVVDCLAEELAGRKAST